MPNQVNVSKNTIIIFISFGIVSLPVATFIVFGAFEHNNITIVSSQGSRTFSVFDGLFTFVINNSEKSENKTISVYGLEGRTNLNISASKLVENSLGTSMALKFDSQEEKTIYNVSRTPQTILVSFLPLQTGLYNGEIFILDDKKTSVPITVEVKPHIALLLMLIVDGIGIAIGLWKLINYLNNRYQVVENGILNITNTPVTFETFLNQRKGGTKKIVMTNFILDFGTVIFGIAFGITTLFDNAFVNEVHNLGPVEIVVLIGIGLGIGSLKEIFRH